MASSLPIFPHFDVHSDGGSVGPRWKKWLSRFERLAIAMDIKNDKRKRALLLHYAGPSVDEIFDTLTDTGDDDDYQQAVTALTAYFTPKVNLAFETYNFCQAKQGDNETIDSYNTRLRQLSQTCDFPDIDKEITAQIILNCTSQRLRRRALRENLTLDKLLDAGRALEASEHQAAELESVPQIQKLNINAIQNNSDCQPRTRFRQENSNRQRSQSRTFIPRSNSVKRYSTRNSGTKCYFCGGQYPHRNTCPAKGKTCNSCGTINHFAKVCRKSNKTVRQTVHSVQSSDNLPKPDSDDNDNNFVYTVTQNQPTHEKIFINRNSTQSHLPDCKVTIQNQLIKMTIDSGASVNILDGSTYQILLKSNEYFETLAPSDTPVYTYGSKSPLHVSGVLSANVKFGKFETLAKFHVVPGTGGNLLGCKTAQELKILHLTQSLSTKPADNTITALQNEFREIFNGIGKVKNKQIKLHINPDVQPKQQPHRRIPFHVRQDVEKELQKLESLDIIEEVDGPTPWVSPIVVVPKKSGSVRICIDMREANKAIQREKHLTPTVDELVNDLNGATVFSKLDLTAGYHQLEISPESRYITTFSTHIGLRRYKRLLFGVNAAAEIFQNAIAELLIDLPGCKNLSDDIIVYSKNQQEHNENLRCVLERLQNNNVTLNKDKCVFSKPEIRFYGHIFGVRGIRPDPQKISTIVNTSPPNNVSEVKSLLGMAQYVSRFIPNYSSITAPLRELTRKDVNWKWEKLQQQSFDNLKSALSGSHVIEYFDPNRNTEIIVDASPAGLGAILMQEGKVISYASRALSDVESRYSQTEREMLGVVWSVEHFHLYVFGEQFTVITDHKPLLGIFKSQKPASARIERWRLRLSPYQCDLRYKPGRNEANPTDYISRHPETLPFSNSIAEDFVNYICTNSVPKAMTLEEIRLETQTDPILQKVILAIQSGDWKDKELLDFGKVNQELTVYDGVILRGYRLVIPKSLHNKAIDLAHISHQGIVKTKQLIRKKYGFLRLTN